jgi:hypothetical protein
VHREIASPWGGRKMVLRKTLRAVTPWGGLSAFIELFKRIDFPERVSRDSSMCWKSDNSIAAGRHRWLRWRFLNHHEKQRDSRRHLHIAVTGTCGSLSHGSIVTLNVN